MLLQDIRTRDPFILAEDGQYYLYVSRRQWDPQAAGGVVVYTSRDLVHWQGPDVCFEPPADFWADRDFWAPEVHRWRGAYYLFISLKSAARRRGTQVLRAKGPLGPFLPISEGPLTPPEWECLDGTLHVDESGRSWMVFCHEWVQIHDGTVCAMPLAPQLDAPAGAPQLLFCASEAPWARPITKAGDLVTDGPFLRRGPDGRLWMLWSSFTSPDNYAQGAAYSEGGVLGPWHHLPQPLLARDSGHGMLFDDFAGHTHLALHRPNVTPLERTCLLDVCFGPQGPAVCEAAHG